MIREAIAKLVAGESLTTAEAREVMEEIMGGQATPAQLGAFLVALRLKGETVDEVVGLAETMRRHALRVPTSGPVADTCGTGGDHSGTFNISTTAAFVLAAAGVPVAKHGNRGMSSHCGSADVLEALGVNIALSPEQAAACLADVGIAFLFAPLYHPAMKHAAGPRREIGVRTVFNLLGPLTNPAGAAYQVLGVPQPEAVELLARALQRLGTRHSLVVHSQDGLDELSLSAPTLICEVTPDQVRTYTVTPEEVGLCRAPREAVRGGSAAENAEVIRRVLAGEPGPARDIVLLNSAAALLASEQVSDLRSGVRLAAEIIDSGAAQAKLEQLVRYTQECRS